MSSVVALHRLSSLLLSALVRSHLPCVRPSCRARPYSPRRCSARPRETHGVRCTTARSRTTIRSPGRTRDRRSDHHSLRAPAREYRRDGPQQDACVERERPLVDVLEVERHPVGEAQVAAAADLPESRDSLWHAEAPNEPCLAEVGEIPSRQWAWPDERHISL